MTYIIEDTTQFSKLNKRFGSKHLGLQYPSEVQVNLQKPKVEKSSYLSKKRTLERLRARKLKTSLVNDRTNFFRCLRSNQNPL